VESGLVVYQGLRSMSGHALVDIYRCYEIWLTVAEAAKLQQGDLMEVGMWRASTGAVIAAQNARLIPSAHLVLCDIHLSG
jgi:hypothetical protein